MIFSRWTFIMVATVTENFGGRAYDSLWTAVFENVVTGRGIAGNDKKGYWIIKHEALQCALHHNSGGRWEWITCKWNSNCAGNLTAWKLIVRVLKNWTSGTSDWTVPMSCRDSDKNKIYTVCRFVGDCDVSKRIIKAIGFESNAEAHFGRKNGLILALPL